MRGKKKENIPIKAEATEKRKPGRQPMTPEQKAAAAKLRAAEREKAENMRPELFLQFQENDVNIADLVEAAKADFHKSKKRTLVTDMKLYVKPEDGMAYYVINDDYTGKVPF